MKTGDFQRLILLFLAGAITGACFYTNQVLENIDDTVRLLVEQESKHTLTFTSAEEFGRFLEEMQKLREEARKDEDTDETP